MMKFDWKMRLYTALTLLSIVMICLQFVLWRESDQSTHLLLHDVLFTISVIPLQVALTTFILDQLLERRVRKERLEKMNMVIGVFFSEVGSELLRRISLNDAGIDGIRGKFIVSDKWAPEDFSNAEKALKNHRPKVSMGVGDLLETRNILSNHRGLLVQLLENPILLEHETFTNALRAVFHLTEELQYRRSFDSLPDSDVAHLNGDVARAYGLLIREWVSYMAYLKVNYPYLYSLAIRTNPFDPSASPVVQPAASASTATSASPGTSADK